MNKDLTIRKLFAATVSLQKQLNTVLVSIFLAGLLVVHSMSVLRFLAWLLLLEKLVAADKLGLFRIYTVSYLLNIRSNYRSATKKKKLEFMWRIIRSEKYSILQLALILGRLKVRVNSLLRIIHIL